MLMNCLEKSPSIVSAQGETDHRSGVWQGGPGDAGPVPLFVPGFLIQAFREPLFAIVFALVGDDGVAQESPHRQDRTCTITDTRP